MVKYLCVRHYIEKHCIERKGGHLKIFNRKSSPRRPFEGKTLNLKFFCDQRNPWSFSMEKESQGCIYCLASWKQKLPAIFQ